MEIDEKPPGTLTPLSTFSSSLARYFNTFPLHCPQILKASRHELSHNPQICLKPLRQSQYSQIDKYRTDPGGQFPGISNTYTAIERYLETDQHFPSSIRTKRTNESSIFTRINPLFRRNLFYRANIYNNTRNGRWVGRANAGRDARRQLLLARRRKRARTVASTTLRVQAGAIDKTYDLRFFCTQ